MDPWLDFWRQLVWDMVENTLDEETEAGGVCGRRLRARRGDLVDHELVIAPTYCGKWLVDENKWRRVKHPYQKQICTNRSGDCKKTTRRYCRCTKGLFIFAECYTTLVIDNDT